MRTLLAAALMALALPYAAHANDDASACTPDVWRLCSAAIPSRERITACLHENKRKLSPPCYQVFNRKPGKDNRPAQREAKPARWSTGSLQ